MGLILGKGRLPAVGGGNLLHQMQAQNVRRVLPCHAGLQGRQHSRRIPRPVIRDRDDEMAAGAVCRQCDGAAPGIVPGGILQQVVQRPRQQRGIGTQQRLPGVLPQREHKAGVRRQFAVAEIRRRLTQQRPRLYLRQPQRLGIVLQLAGQIQVFHKGFDFLCLCLNLFCGFVRLQPLGIPHNERQRRADVVAHPGHPVCAGGIPPGQRLILAAQQFSRAVQRPGQFRQHPLRLHRHGLSLRQRVQSLPNTAQAAPEAPQQQTAYQQRRRQHESCRLHRAAHRYHHRIRCAVKAVPPDAPLCLGQHHQTVVIAPHKHRIPVQIPAGKPRHFPDGVGPVQFIRQTALPNHATLLIQLHSPFVAVQPFLRRVGGIQRESAPRPAQRLGHLPHLMAGIGIVFGLVQAHPHQHRQGNDHQRQSHPHRRQQTARRQFTQCFHGCTSRR